MRNFKVKCDDPETLARVMKILRQRGLECSMDRAYALLLKTEDHLNQAVCAYSDDTLWTEMQKHIELFDYNAVDE